VTGVDSATPVEVRAGEERYGIDLQLRPVGAFRVSGSIDGPRDVIDGLTVRLIPAGLDALGLGAEVATTLVGSDGRFMFLNVPSGRYTIISGRTATELVYAGGLSSNLPRAPAYEPGGFSADVIPTLGARTRRPLVLGSYGCRRERSRR
jgi:hypothetical protein